VEAAEAKAIEVMAPLQQAFKKLDHDVEAVKAGLQERFKNFSFDKHALTADITGLKIGGVLAVNFTVEGDSRQHQVVVVRKSAKQVTLRGIPVQTEPVNIDGVVGRIMRAYNRSELATQQPTPSVVRMVDQLPTLREEMAA
jgi:hypothetical protein